MLAKAIAVKVLLVSDDIQIIDTLCHFMEQIAMHVEVCSEPNSAARKLCHAKFEALAVDFKNPAEALELLKKLRETTSHKGVVVLAILNSSHEMPAAFRAGASFALVKPLISAAVTRTLRASYPIMVRERRRYYRSPLDVAVNISSASRPDFIATAVNISEGGMAVTTSAAIQVGERVYLKLKLPGTERITTINGEVCWNNLAGRVGLHFVHVPAEAMEALQSWLGHRLEECVLC